MEVVRMVMKNGAKNKEINDSVKDVLKTIKEMRANREAKELEERKAKIALEATMSTEITS